MKKKWLKEVWIEIDKENKGEYKKKIVLVLSGDDKKELERKVKRTISQVRETAEIFSKEELE